MSVNKLMTFIKRLDKIGISVDMWSNYPWIYLEKVNNKNVEEKFQSDHKFTVAFCGRGDDKIHFTDLPEIFRILRKYSVPTRDVLIEKHIIYYSKS